jgi:hypothetical protein
MAEGIANAIEGRTGRESCRECTIANLDAFDTAGEDNRGRKAERTDRVVM